MAPFNGPSGQELRSTNKPMYGSSAVNINDTIYIYGGFYSVSPWNMEALWRLTNTASNAKITQIPTDPYASPALIYSQILSPNESLLYAFGGHHPVDFNATQAPEPLRYYRFDFSSYAWTPLQKDNGPPYERYWHTATISSDHKKAYIFGGMNITGPIADYFWIYDFALDEWSTGVTEKVSSRCGHTASMLSDGSLVLLGGYACTGNYTTNSAIPKQLFPLDSASVYDTMRGFWKIQKLGGARIPASRTYHSAVTTHNDKIILCGGQDGAPQPFQKYLAGNGDKEAMTAILDTKSWNWSFPPPSPYQPFPRSHATASILNGTTMVFGFGINYHTIFDGIYLFDTVNSVWLPPVIPDQTTNGKQASSVGSIAAISTVLGLVLLLAVWLLLRRLHIRLCHIGQKLMQGLWTPRAGEPLWAEVTRLLCRLVFFGIFIVVVVMMVFQVRDSPIIDQKYYTRREDNTVDVPDIRFCFDGWEHSNSKVLPFLQCATDFAVSCSEYLLNITSNVQTGLNYYGKNLECFLFRAPESFRLGRTSDRVHGAGSYLKFYYYGDRLPSNESRVHVSFYNKYHDPNFAVYGIDDPYNISFSWYRPEENAQFQSMEQENLRTDNSFDLDPYVVSTASYSLYERDSIRTDENWNYVGMAVIRDKTFGIETSVKSESLVSEYASDPQPLGSLHIFPTSYDLAIIREQRAFSLLNAMGIVGGIFGLIVGLQAYLFGYRPRSPWGVIHRWSVGQMRRSLLQGLLSTFPKGVNVPIVHPVHRRFSMATSRTRNSEHTMRTTAKRSLTDPPGRSEEMKTVKLPEEDYDEEEGNRMGRLEERMHVMEMIFQAYYINDEVFRSLAHALQSDLRQERRDRTRRRKFSFFESQNDGK